MNLNWNLENSYQNEELNPLQKPKEPSLNEEIGEEDDDLKISLPLNLNTKETPQIEEEKTQLPIQSIQENQDIWKISTDNEPNQNMLNRKMLNPIAVESKYECA